MTFSVIACLMIVYVCLMVMCVRLDRHDAQKALAVPLEDNTSRDRQVYLVVLETGFRRGAGTTAKVSAIYIYR